MLFSRSLSNPLSKSIFQIPQYSKPCLLFRWLSETCLVFGCSYRFDEVTIPPETATGLYGT